MIVFALLLVFMQSFSTYGSGTADQLQSPSEAEFRLWPHCRHHTRVAAHIDGDSWGIHSYDPGWSFGPNMTEETDGCLPVFSMVQLLSSRDSFPKLLPFREICHKPMHLDDFGGVDDTSVCEDPDIDQRRLAAACPLIPGILVETTENPCHARFRMVDGRHRLCRLKSIYRITHGWFYVLTSSEALALTQPPPCDTQKKLTGYTKQQIERFINKSAPRALLSLLERGTGGEL